MYTQITCPNCGTPYTAEVHQLIDVGRQPELKQLLLSGQVNMAVCPNCGAGGQIGTPLVYHDPAHELFMIYVPQELNLDQVQREQQIGQLTRQVMEATPPEQRRAYMLQPQQILSMQTFLEKVLETEGVTKEMIERQRKQADLLNTLARADSDVQDYLIKERAGEIDETFFAMLRSYIDTASQMNDNRQLLPLVNLQARLMTGTPVGRELEKRQIAMHALSREAKERGGITPQLLLKHILRNQEDRGVVEAMVQAGAGALTYEFFTGLSAEIEKQRLAGKQDAANRLTSLRDELLQLQQEMEQQSRAMLEGARDTLDEILAADDMEAALNANLDEVDDLFMYLLSAEMTHAEQNGHDERLQQLERLEGIILKQIQDQTPPEIRLLNDLMRAENEAEQDQLLDENPALISDDLLKVVDLLQDQLKSSGREDLVDQLGRAKAKIAVRI